MFAAIESISLASTFCSVCDGRWRARLRIYFFLLRQCCRWYGGATSTGNILKLKLTLDSSKYLSTKMVDSWPEFPHCFQYRLCIIDLNWFAHDLIKQTFANFIALSWFSSWLNTDSKYLVHFVSLISFFEIWSIDSWLCFTHFSIMLRNYT